MQNTELRRRARPVLDALRTLALQGRTPVLGLRKKSCRGLRRASPCLPGLYRRNRYLEQQQPPVPRLLKWCAALRAGCQPYRV